jgi:hypothetical protein
MEIDMNRAHYVKIDACRRYFRRVLKVVKRSLGDHGVQ